MPLVDDLGFNLECPPFPRCTMLARKDGTRRTATPEEILMWRLLEVQAAKLGEEEPAGVKEPG